MMRKILIIEDEIYARKSMKSSWRSAWNRKSIKSWKL